MQPALSETLPSRFSGIHSFGYYPVLHQSGCLVHGQPIAAEHWWVGAVSLQVEACRFHQPPEDLGCLGSRETLLFFPRLAKARECMQLKKLGTS